MLPFIYKKKDEIWSSKFIWPMYIEDLNYYAIISFEWAISEFPQASVSKRG